MFLALKKKKLVLDLHAEWHTLCKQISIPPYRPPSPPPPYPLPSPTFGHGFMPLHTSTHSVEPIFPSSPASQLANMMVRLGFHPTIKLITGKSIKVLSSGTSQTAYGQFQGYSCYIFAVLCPLLMSLIYISLISFFTVVALYPDLTQHKIIISEICYMYAV